MLGTPMWSRTAAGFAVGWRAAALAAPETKREPALLGLMACLLADEASSPRVTVRLHMIIFQTIEAQANKVLGNGLYRFRRRAPGPAMAAVDLVVAIGVWRARGAGGVRDVTGDTVARRRGLQVRTACIGHEATISSRRRGTLPPPRMTPVCNRSLLAPANGRRGGGLRVRRCLKVRERDPLRPATPELAGKKGATNGLRLDDPKKWSRRQLHSSEASSSSTSSS